MRISVLVDNTPGVNTLAEFGLSYFIDYDGKQILFDTAQSDLFLRNAKIMNLDTKKVDQIILSHGHFDHGNGLNYINGGKLVCHPACFVKRYRKTDHTYIGLKNSYNEIAKKFELTTSSQPIELFSGAFFLGEIPRVTDFESQTTPFVLDDGTPDFVMDDSALAFKVTNGIFIITGCGHSGIVNTLEHAKKVTGENRIVGIMGGFHLKENNLQTKKTIAYLRDNNVKQVYPSHCTALAALAEFYSIFKTPQVKTGDQIIID